MSCGVGSSGRAGPATGGASASVAGRGAGAGPAPLAEAAGFPGVRNARVSVCPAPPRLAVTPGPGLGTPAQTAVSDPNARAVTTTPTHDRETNGEDARSGSRGMSLLRSGGPDRRSTSLMTESRLLGREEFVGRSWGADHERWFGFEPRSATTPRRYRRGHAATETPEMARRLRSGVPVSSLWCRRTRPDHENREVPGPSSSSFGQARRSRPARHRGSSPLPRLRPIRRRRRG